MPLSENFNIHDFRKKLIGNFHIELIPCDQQGITFDDIENFIVYEPEKEFKELYYIVKLNGFKSISRIFNVSYNIKFLKFSIKLN